MASLINRFILAFLVLLSSCGSQLSKDLSPNRVAEFQFGEKMRGSFILPNGNQVQLENDNGKPTVLIFSAEFCGICQSENENFRDSLRDPQVPPANVNLYTVMVGVPESVAQEWKTDFRLPWAVGADPRRELFLQYCPENITPCTVVHTPKDGIVYRKVDESRREEIEKFTGPWE